MTSLRLVLDGCPPVHIARALSPNGRTFWAERHTAVTVMAWYVKRALGESDWDGQMLAAPVILRATFVLPQRRQRDQDNFTAITKPAIDSLVRAGVLRGDDTGLLWIEPVVLEVQKGERRLVLDLESRVDPAGLAE